MKYVVIGTGKSATAYARAMADEGWELVIGDRQPVRAASLAKQIGRDIEGGGIAAAVKIADLVLLALPYPATIVALADVGDLVGKILVDSCHTVSADFQDLVIGLTDSAAQALQAATPRAHVVKAFNTISVHLIPISARSGRKLQVFVATTMPAPGRKCSKWRRRCALSPSTPVGCAAVGLLEPMELLNIQLGQVLGGGGAGVAPAWTSA
ncbi:NADPH-dependent F420 reductase [Xanthomonas populi]|uniref:NADPH-dependent F420 reductase n=1 Tax=Xanthomonas populi TaxID=53414 RepID=UPI001ABFFC1E|nr:NAD(P)-binding domain-containing protein [Xanthomonas populi]